MFFSAATAARPSSVKFSPYLFSHRNSLTFRIRIPADIQSCLGKSEYRRSIGRCYAAEAKLRALKLAAAAFEVFSFARAAVLARNDGQEETLTGGAGRSMKRRPSGSTFRNVKQEKSTVYQEKPGVLPGYTDEFQGRALSSLTDEEIRAIAEAWLLDALKGSNLALMQFAPLRVAARRGGNKASPPEDVQSVLESLGAVEKNTDAPPSPRGAPPQKGTFVSPADPAVQAAMVEQAEAEAATAERLKGIYQKSLAGRHVTRMAHAADKQLAAHGIQVDPATESAAAVAAGTTPSAPYLQTCQELLKARVTFSGVMAQSHRGDYAAYDAEVARLEDNRQKRREKRRIKVTSEGGTPPVLAAAENTPASPTLSAALKLFMDEQVRMGRWDADSRRRAMDKYTLFQAIINPDGSLLINKIGAEHLRTYVKTLIGIPANRNKKRAYRDIPLPVLLAEAQAERIPEADRITRITAINHCQMITTFLNWAAANEYHTNPAITRLLRLEKPELTEEEERDPYTPDDIVKLFNPRTFLTAGLRRAQKIAVPDSGEKASRFWVPLLGLFTGARMEELAQLHTDDIVLVDQQRNRRRVFSVGQPSPSPAAVLQEAREKGETLCIFINKSKGYQKLKNKTSRRYVPLSSLLVDDLGFLGYVAAIFQAADAAQQAGTAADDNGRLFPELKKTAGAGKYGHKLSHWYSEYRQRVGVVSGEDGEGKKVFHCFRNTISDWCAQQSDIQHVAVSSYLGHKNDNITFDIYSKGTLPGVLYEIITSRFTEYVKAFLDIDGLKTSTWARHGK